jgi:hypothetical protein
MIFRNSMLLIKVHILRRSGIAIYAAILIALFLTGCNHGILTSQLAHINTNLDELVIVPEPIDYSPKYKPWAGDPVSGFGKGAGEGIATTFSKSDQGDTGPFVGVVLFLTTVTGGVIGGTIGAFQAVPEEVSSEIKRNSAAYISNRNINESIGYEIYSNSLKTRSDLNPVIMKREIPPAGEDGAESQEAFYERLKQKGKKTALHIKTTSLTLEGGCGRTPSFTLHIQTHTELVSLANNRILFQKDYEYIGKKQDWDSWSQFRGSIIGELAAAYSQIGNQIYTEQIDMPAHCIPFKSDWFSPSAEISGNACFLRPVYPEAKLKGPIETFADRDGLYIQAIEVDSMQPTLKWESFPRPRDKTAVNAEIIKNITHVVYGLKIWRRTEGYGRILVYERDMLTKPEHQVETTLMPGTDYLWSFRATYQYEGKPRDIPWAFYNYMLSVPCRSCYCDIEKVPDENLFRFKIPVSQQNQMKYIYRRFGE